MRFSTPAVALVASLLFASCSESETNPEPTVENAWIRLPVVAGRPGAAYFTIRTGQSDVLLQVSTPASARAEMHESMDRGAGMAAMRPLETLALGEGETRFEPGGKHVMLYELDPTLRPGGTVALTLHFARMPSATVQAQTVSAGEPAPGD